MTDVIWNDKKYGSLPTPRKIDFTCIYVYKSGEIIINGVSKNLAIQCIADACKKRTIILPNDKQVNTWMNKNFGSVKQLLNQHGYIIEEVADEELFKTAIAETRVKNIGRIKKYKEELFRHCGLDPQIADIIYERAYQESKSYGMHEVETTFNDLLAFAEELFNAAKVNA